MRHIAIGLKEFSKFTRKPATAFAALIVLAGCNSAGNKGSAADALDLSGQQQSSQQTTATDLRAFCPKAIVRGGTETLRLYEPVAKRSDPDAPKTVRFQATITEVVRECIYNGDLLNVRIGIKGRVINGPTAASGDIELPIRIAATNAQKEVPYTNLTKISATIQPGGNYASFRFVENNITVPKPQNRDLIFYVGFDEGPTDKKKVQ